MIRRYRWQTAALFIMTMGGCVAACASSLSDHKIPSSHIVIRQLRMGMTAEEVVRVLPDTPCKVATLYHGNPAQAWGYEASGSPPALPPKASSCEKANYWIYFEKDRLVGWTPLP